MNWKFRGHLTLHNNTEESAVELMRLAVTQSGVIMRQQNNNNNNDYNDEDDDDDDA